MISSAIVSKQKLSFSATPSSEVITWFSYTKVIFLFLVDLLEKQGFTTFKNVFLSVIYLTFRLLKKSFLVFLTKLTHSFFVFCMLAYFHAFSPKNLLSERERIIIAFLISFLIKADWLFQLCFFLTGASLFVIFSAAFCNKSN